MPEAKIFFTWEQLHFLVQELESLKEVHPLDSESGYRQRATRDAGIDACIAKILDVAGGKV